MGADDCQNEVALEKSVTFRATFPAIQSAIKIGGDGGARIQLDVPESDLAEFAPSMAWRGEVLQVTISVLQNENAKRPNKQSSWQTED